MKKHYLLFFLLLGAFFPVSSVNSADTAAESKPLTVEQKVYGLSQFWKEVSYNFAHWKTAGDLDWDEAYFSLLPQVMASQSDFEYYQLMLRFCALLKDGHTNIYLPKDMIKNNLGRLPFKVIEIGQRAIISDVDLSLKHQIPVGSEILEIDSTPVAKIAEEQVFPLISTSAPHMYWDQAYRSLTSVGAGILFGPQNSLANVKIKSPDGAVMTVSVARDYYERQIQWTQVSAKRDLLEHQILDANIAYVALNSFSDSQIVDQFREILPKISKASAVIIDLRNNGGGNSNNSSAIVGHFTDRPFTGASWQSVVHDGAFRAWGRVSKEYKSMEQYRDYYFGHKYEVRDATVYQPSDGLKITAPTVVLIGHKTGSAAEDFLIMADEIEHMQFVGEPTFGSTGQPLMMELPGGGSARISAKRDFYPDGREFIGFGIQPDVLVPRTVEDFWAGHDAALEEAVSQLKQRMN